MMIQDTTMVGHLSFAPGSAFRQGLLVLATLPLLFAAVQVRITRRAGPRIAWLVCGITAGALALLWIGSIVVTWPGVMTPIGSAVYMIVVACIIPFAAATLVIVRSVVRHPQRATIAHFGLGWLAFAGGLVIGLVLGAIPDLLRTFA